MSTALRPPGLWLTIALVVFLLALPAHGHGVYAGKKRDEMPRCAWIGGGA